MPSQSSGTENEFWDQRSGTGTLEEVWLKDRTEREKCLEEHE